MLTAKQRDSSLQMFDDLTPPYTQRSISLGKPSMISSSQKPSETENSLPIPMHIRAASTPAHIEAQRNEQIRSSHKRYPSCVETSPRQHTNKFSIDSYITRPADDRHSKRASSESKEKITKRNASSPAAISLLVSAANNKPQNCHPDDRNKMPGKQYTLPIKASSELLAELLRGSSEKMTMTAERERNEKIRAELYTLPVAVQQLSVSILYRMYFTFTVQFFFL